MMVNMLWHGTQVMETREQSASYQKHTTLNLGMGSSNIYTGIGPQILLEGYALYATCFTLAHLADLQSSHTHPPPMEIL